MNDTLDWNAKTIAEFRANEGRVGRCAGTRQTRPAAGAASREPPHCTHHDMDQTTRRDITLKAWRERPGRTAS